MGNRARVLVGLLMLNVAIFLGGLSHAQEALGGRKLLGGPFVLPPSTEFEMEAARKSLDTQGFVDRPAQIRPVDNALEKLRLRRAEVAEAELKSGSRLSAKKRGFIVIGLERPSDLPFPIADVPADFLRAGSENYLLSSGNQVTRVYSDTELGPLFVREIAKATLHAEGADERKAMLGGYAAYVSTVRFSGGKWATAIMGSRGERVFHIEIGTRLDSERARELADRLVASILAY